MMNSTTHYTKAALKAFTEKNRFFDDGYFEDIPLNWAQRIYYQLTNRPKPRRAKITMTKAESKTIKIRRPVPFKVKT